MNALRNPFTVSPLTKPPRPARSSRAYHYEKKKHRENTVQTFIGIAADSVGHSALARSCQLDAFGVPSPPESEV